MNNESHPWLELYRSALLELDHTRLRHLVDSAERAIRERMSLIESLAERAQERADMRDALQNLRVLSRELARGEDSRPAQPETKGEYVVAVDSNRRYVAVTEGVCRLLGYSRDELLSMKIDDLAAPELQSSVPATFRKYVAQGSLAGQYAIKAKDGRRIDIYYDAKVLPDGSLVARWQPVHDVAA